MAVSYFRGGDRARCATLPDSRDCFFPGCRHLSGKEGKAEPRGFRSSVENGVGADRKPGSVPHPGLPEYGDDHSSRTAVACCLQRHYPRTSSGPLYNVLLFGLAPDGVYQAFPVTRKTVSSYLAFSPLPDHIGRYFFCGTFLRVASSRR